MDFPLWKQLVTEAVVWREFEDEHIFELYQRTALVWGMGEEYIMQSPLGDVNLTKLLEQYKILTTLKGTHHGSQINSENC